MDLEPSLYYLNVSLPRPEQSKKEIREELEFLLKLLKSVPLTTENRRIKKLSQTWCKNYEEHRILRFELQNKKSYAKLYKLLEPFYDSLKSQKNYNHILRSALKVKQKLDELKENPIRDNPEYDDLWRPLTTLVKLHHKLLGPGTEKTDKRKARKLKQTAASKDSACSKNFMSRNRIRFTTSMLNQAAIETDYFAFLENIALDLLNYIKHNRDLLQVKEDAKYILEEAKGKSNINPFFMFLTWQAQPEKRLQTIKQEKNYSLYWQQFKQHLKYYLFYIDQIASAQPKPYCSKLVKVATLHEVVSVREKPPKDNSYLRILQATCRHLNQAGQKISVTTLKRWIKHNQQFYPKYEDAENADIVNRLSADECVEWFENLKWVNGLFAKQLNEYLESKS